MEGLDAVVGLDGVLHLVPAQQHPRIAFSKAHGLRNEYFKHMLDAVKTEHLGWVRLEMARYLQHAPSGALVVVAGQLGFYENRGAACERAGLASDAMAFSLRQFDRLMDPEDTCVELDGWSEVERPSVVRVEACKYACDATAAGKVCGCMSVNLFDLINAARQASCVTVSATIAEGHCVSLTVGTRRKLRHASEASTSTEVAVTTDVQMNTEVVATSDVGTSTWVAAADPGPEESSKIFDPICELVSNAHPPSPPFALCAHCSLLCVSSSSRTARASSR
jgi:hypothetical protein